MMSNKTYDVIKWIAQYLLPALGTLVLTLASIFNMPYGEQIGGVIMALDTFLGMLLGVSTYHYNNAVVHNDAEIDDGK